MSDGIDDEKCPKCVPGLPAWMGTFADLMTLLMCFFVLLLSFSEMDVERYKQVAGSMKFAFGVQKQIKTLDVPKGTSIVAREFSPGKPQKTVLKVLQQRTIDDTRQTLEYTDSDARGRSEMSERGINEQSRDGEESDETESRAEADDAYEAKLIAESMAKEIKAGLIEVERRAGIIIIRIREQGSFRSGQARAQPGFDQVLGKLETLLAIIQGRINVVGHTDDIPISTARFSSNWGLSGARAAYVAERLLSGGMIMPERVVVMGLADTQPLLPNDSPDARTLNRRVELVIESITENSSRDVYLHRGGY